MINFLILVVATITALDPVAAPRQMLLLGILTTINNLIAIPRQRVVKVESTMSNMLEIWLKNWELQAVKFDGLELRLSASYINTIRASLNRLYFKNPNPPSFCTVVQFVGPYRDRYNVIVLNDIAAAMVCAVLVIVVIVSGIILFMYLFRKRVKANTKAEAESAPGPASSETSSI